VILGNGLQVDLRVVEPQHWGAALQYFTGSKEHNVALRELALKQGWSLNEYGLTATGDGAAPAGEQRFFAEEENCTRFWGWTGFPLNCGKTAARWQAARDHELPALITMATCRANSTATPPGATAAPASRRWRKRRAAAAIATGR
jgi:DNA polymerase (family 10)